MTEKTTRRKLNFLNLSIMIYGITGIVGLWLIMPWSLFLQTGGWLVFSGFMVLMFGGTVIVCLMATEMWRERYAR